LTVEEVHGKLPLGVDAAGAAYYWFDMPFEHGQTAGVVGSRIYRSGPPEEAREEVSQQQQQQQQGPGVSSNSLPPKVPLRWVEAEGRKFRSEAKAEGGWRGGCRLGL
jgi:hypothetical protein